MIRQAISCDICGAEKKQSNHWFVAWESDGELRIGGWNARSRQRSGSRHLCGQGCLHKLADEFLARLLARQAQEAPPVQAEATAAARVESRIAVDTDLEFESSARLLPAQPNLPAVAPPAARPAAVLVPMPQRVSEAPAVPALDSMHHSPRMRRAEAWERERERMMQSRRA